MPVIHIRIEDDTAARITAMGRGKGSDYVRSVVEQRESEVRGALRVLEAAGWDIRHIRQACGALDGAQHVHDALGGGLWSGLGLAIQDATIGQDGSISGRPTYRTLLELHDAARLGRIEVDADRWGGLLAEAAQRPQIVLALQVLARDYWTCEGVHPEIDEEG